MEAPETVTLELKSKNCDKESTICPATVKTGTEVANLTDEAFYRDYFARPNLKNVIFWHGIPGRPRKILHRLYDEWRCSMYDSKNGYHDCLNEKGIMIDKEHFINQSYVLAFTARHLNLTAFLLAIDITEKDLTYYHQYEPLSFHEDRRPPFVDVFCAVERLAMHDRDIFVISTKDTADYCIRTSPERCQEQIERERRRPGFIGVDELCGHIDY